MSPPNAHVTNAGFACAPRNKQHSDASRSVDRSGECGGCTRCRRVCARTDHHGRADALEVREQKTRVARLGELRRAAHVHRAARDLERLALALLVAAGRRAPLHAAHVVDAEAHLERADPLAAARERRLLVAHRHQRLSTRRTCTSIYE